MRWVLAALAVLALALALAASFGEERDELVAAARAERAAREREAQAALEARVAASLTEWAEHPERAEGGLYVRAQGEQRWPVQRMPSLARQLAALEGSRASAVAAIGAVADPTEAYRALLVLRAHERVEPELELATALSALSALGARASPELLRAELVSGLADARHGRLRPVNELLLEVSADDREIACERARRLAPALELPACRSWAEPPLGVVEVAVTTTATRPLLVDGWWIVRGPDRVVAAELDAAARLAGDGATLRDGRVELALPGLEAREARASAWYARKLALLGAFVAALVGLGWARARAIRRERELLELRARFAATVSHELQTPLAAVRVMAETLERRLEGDARAKGYPARIVAEIDRLGALVDNILAYQRVAQGRWTLSRSRVRLDELAPELEREAERAAGRPVEVDTGGLTGVEVDADPRLLELALANLVRNACRHNRRSPVKVALRAGGGRVEVEDNGVGVPAEEVEGLFRENVRGLGAVGKGTGLGLALVDRIARLHGGRASLARSSPEGSVFVLELGPPP